MCLRETTRPTRSVVCADSRHSRSLRGWPSCCSSPPTKVPQVECTGDDDAEDEQCLWEGHELTPMTGKLKARRTSTPRAKATRCRSHFVSDALAILVTTARPCLFPSLPPSSPACCRPDHHIEIPWGERSPGASKWSSTYRMGLSSLRPTGVTVVTYPGWYPFWGLLRL
jgi:hypothetical protein